MKKSYFLAEMDGAADEALRFAFTAFIQKQFSPPAPADGPGIINRALNHGESKNQHPAAAQSKALLSEAYRAFSAIQPAPTPDEEELLHEAIGEALDSALIAREAAELAIAKLFTNLEFMKALKKDGQRGSSRQMVVQKRRKAANQNDPFKNFVLAHPRMSALALEKLMEKAGIILRDKNTGQILDIPAKKLLSGATMASRISRIRNGRI